MSGRTFIHDLFITYSHADGRLQWIKGLIDRLAQHRAEVSPDALRVFLDETTIRSMDDWHARILVGLKSAKLMLAIVSPNYFASEFCRKEWDRFLQHERDRGILGEGIAPIYVVTVPDMASRSGDDWKRDLASRQYVDLRDVWEHGVETLGGPDVRPRLVALEQSIADRLSRFTSTAQSPTNVPFPPDSFVGRVRELAEARRLLSQGRVGAVVVLQGIGGIGKSAIAQQFALTYASDYPGGRFLVSAADVRSLKHILLRLLSPLGIALSDETRKDPDEALRAVQGALTDGPKRLLVLDNVEDPSLLAPPQVADLVPRTDQVEILATTRLEPGAFPGARVVPVESFSTQEGVALLGRYRRLEPAQSEHARELVELLGGHALAIEVVGVFLWRNPDVDIAGFRKRLISEGVRAVDDVAEDARHALSRHGESSIRRLLEPTLAGLSVSEARTLGYAALFAPDAVPVPWVHALVRSDCPELQSETPQGYPDPWMRILRRLSGLRLLTEGRAPELGRIHRIVRGVVLARLSPVVLGELKSAFFTYIWRQATLLAGEWASPPYRWSIEPLLELVPVLLDEGEPEQATRLTTLVAVPLWELARYEEARSLIARALHAADSDPETLVALYGALARVQRSMREPSAAMESMLRAEKVLEGNPDLSAQTRALCFNNIGRLLLDLGESESAEVHLRRALAIYRTEDEENVFGRGTCMFNLAQIAIQRDEVEKARDLLEESLALREQHRVFGSQADLVGWLETARMLSELERDDGNFGRAHELLQQALARARGSFAGPHPVVARLQSGLATIENLVGRPHDAARSARAALEMAERALPAPDRTTFLERLALAEKEAGNLDIAMDLHARLLAQHELRGTPSRAWHQVLASMAQLETARGNLKSARDHAQRSIDMQERLLHAEEEMSVGLLSDAYWVLADIERREQNASGFESAVRKSLETAEHGHIVTADEPWPERYVVHAQVLRAMNSWNEVCRALRRLLELMEAGNAPAHVLARTREGLAEAMQRAAGS